MKLGCLSTKIITDRQLCALSIFLLFMSRVTVEATAPLADLPGSNLFDRDKATAAMTAASP